MGKKLENKISEEALLEVLGADEGHIKAKVLVMSASSDAYS